MNFNHPYTPYPIQVDFMEALYETIESYKVGIFESPTGTGKTLSLICGAMTWLRRNKAELSIQKHSKDDSEPDWVHQQSVELAREEFARNRELLQQRLDKWRRKNMRTRIRQEERVSKKQRVVEDSDDSIFLPDDYTEGLNPELQRLLSALEPQKTEGDFDEPVKIIFASRTHSQLSQFVGQLQNVTFPPSSDLQTEESTKHISLGSRKQLCVHPTVSRVKNTLAMNESCRDYKKKGQCKFFKTEHDPLGKVDIAAFRDAALAEIMDIEDLYKLGKHNATCPYYASRAAIPAAEIITVPYQILLSRLARKAVNLPVKNSIIIIDEAHNLLDTIAALHSMTVTQLQVSTALSGLIKYQTKFESRLNPGNRVNLGYLVNILQSLDLFFTKCGKKDKKETSPGTAINSNSLFEGTTADLINVHKLEKYIDESKIVFKIESYLEFEEERSGDTSDEGNKSSPPVRGSLVLSSVLEFLREINNPDSEGTLCFDGPKTLKYQLLDPSNAFKPLVEDSRCVILAGGTMEPVTDYLDYLFPYLTGKDGSDNATHTSPIKLFSCGHVIPKNNLNVNVLPRGLSGSFNFTFDRRNDVKMILDIATTLTVCSRVIPEGIVVFFPSYKYLEQVLKVWKGTLRKGQSVYDILNASKTVFLESQTESVESVLTDYAEKVASNNGAILLSVVGGKMSEGINFSDGLARAVFMIGLPFPNFMSAEIIAKRKFIENNVLAKTGSKELAMSAARDFYENICMRAVNQSVGRAIRHANDYSCIFLVDERFSKDAIQQKLSGWMKEDIKQDSFKHCVDRTKEFFEMHNEK